MYIIGGVLSNFRNKICKCGTKLLRKIDIFDVLIFVSDDDDIRIPLRGPICG